MVKTNKKSCRALRRLCGIAAVLAFVLGVAGVEVMATASTPNPRETGESLYIHYCAHCHGSKGGGDGYNAEFLEKEPAELGNLKFIAKKTNEQIFRVISSGGIGVKKSQLMPPFGNTLSESEIWSLVAHIRSLAQDKDHPATLPKDISKELPETSLPSADQIKEFSTRFANAGKDAQRIESGSDIFFKKKSCSACHRVGEQGGVVGPDLSRAGYSYSPEWLFAWIQNPQKIKPGTKMPTIALEGEEVLALTAYLSSLTGNGLSAEWAPYLEGSGDAKRGESIFFDANGNAECSKCHSVRNKGGNVGPALTLVGDSRTPAFLLESILDPSAVITVGFSSMMVLTREGKLITGIKKNEDDSTLDLLDKEGQIIHLIKSKIKKFKAQKISVMPGNFKEILSVDQVRDLLAFLKTLTLY